MNAARLLLLLPPHLHNAARLLLLPARALHSRFPVRVPRVARPSNNERRVVVGLAALTPALVALQSTSTAPMSGAAGAAVRAGFRSGGLAGRGT